MNLSASDLQAVLLTLQLAGTVTLILLLIGTPIAWWLAHSRASWKVIVNVVVAMPLVLPPSVIGFYFLMAMGPNGPIGSVTSGLGLGVLPFTFWGLVFASCIYSLPFVVQPLQNAFTLIGVRPIEMAATLRSGPWDRFIHVVIPLAKPGFITAAVLGFAHTVGEFGVVLMIGGNIPGETKVASIQIYDHVESMQYTQAHTLSAVMLVFAFSVLFFVYYGQRKKTTLVSGL